MSSELLSNFPIIIYDSAGRFIPEKQVNFTYNFNVTGSIVGLTKQAGNELNSYDYRPSGEDFYEYKYFDTS